MSADENASSVEWQRFDEEQLVAKVMRQQARTVEKLLLKTKKGDFFDHEMVMVAHLVADPSMGTVKKSEPKPISPRHYGKTFNENMYTSVAEASRADLRKALSVCAAIDLIWIHLDWDDQQSRPAHERLLYKEHYLQFHSELVRVLYGEGALECFELKQMAEEDWKRDSGGFNYLHLENFQDALFEIVDLW